MLSFLFENSRKTCRRNRVATWGTSLAETCFFVTVNIKAYVDRDAMITKFINKCSIIHQNYTLGISKNYPVVMFKHMNKHFVNDLQYYVRLCVDAF